MELKFKTILNKPLTDLGMKSAFYPETADFTGISDKSTFIGNIIQATYIKVDEEGTEAAAVTMAEMYDSAIHEPISQVIFNMNRPFAFIIREKDSNTILFMGKVNKL